MKRNHFAKKIVHRNYAPRILAVVLAAALLAVCFAVLMPLLLRQQLGELRTRLEEREKQEQTGEVPSKEPGKKEILKSLTPVGTGVKVTAALFAVAFLALGVFYWITLAEWLFRMAVLHGLNRALWPILGMFFNLFAALALLIVLYDPKRMAREQAAA